LWKAAGFKNPDKFLHPPAIDPQTGQPQQPQPKPDPAVLAAQEQGKALVQQEAVKQQGADKRLPQEQMLEKYKVDQQEATKVKLALIQAAKDMLIASGQIAQADREMALKHNMAAIQQQANAIGALNG